MRYATSALARMYSAAPEPLRNAVRLVPFGIRIGPVYRKTLRDVVAAETLSADALRAEQTVRLRRLLQTAFELVPYYRRKYWALRNEDPWLALSSIEPITKSDIQKDPSSFRNPTRPSYVTRTGGTSGVPLEVHLDRESFQIEWGYQIAQWARAGFRPGMKRATFRGTVLADGRLWDHNPVYDEVRFSPFAMNDANLSRYLAKLHDYRPDFLYGYPSALSVLARFAKASGAVLPKLKGLLCGSEGLRAGQRELLEGVFKARLFSWYGMSEKVVLAGECESTHDYHAFPTYGLVEILSDNGQVSSSVGAEGEIVGTGFLNESMPYIRYRTGDRSKITAHSCPSCRRISTIMANVQGRWNQEMIVGKSGALVSVTALNMHDATMSDVVRFRFHQAVRGQATLQVVSAKQMGPPELERIANALRSRTAHDIDWDVRQVENLPLTPRGKNVYLVQELELETH